MLALKKLSPTRLVKNEFYRLVAEAEARNASADELLQLIGTGRTKRGIFEGDVADGELEIGQIATLTQDLSPAGDIVRRIMEEYAQRRKESVL